MRNILRWLHDHLTWRPGEVWNAIIREKYGIHKFLLPVYYKHRLVSFATVKKLGYFKEA